jgi:nucleoside-diphosphate-sugar epimerase
LSRELVQNGYEVIIYDAFLNFCSPFESNYQLLLKKRFEGLLDKVTMVRGDIRVQNRIIQHLIRFKPDIIVHLAALADANQCRMFPEEANAINVDGTLKVLESMRHVDSVKRFLFTSSSFVYGHFKYHPADEVHPLVPIDVYGGTKLTGETLTQAYCREFGVAYTIIRPSAVYGFGDPNWRVSHILVRDALLGKPLTLDGGGTAVLDFSYIKDVARGFFLAIHSGKAENEIFNITRGEGRSVREFAEVIKRYVPDAKLVVTPPDDSRPKRGALDISKARSQLGYNPRYRIEDGIREYLDDYRREVPLP